MQVVWTRGAARAVDRALQRIVEFNHRAARRLEEGLHMAGEGLATAPRRGRRVEGTEIRELTISYSYILRYEMIGEAVVILGIRHIAAQRREG